MQRFIFVCIFLIYSGFIWSFEVIYEDISGAEQVDKRIKFINQSQYPGIRIHVGGIKEANKDAGGGRVNETLAEYQQQLKQSLEQLPQDIKIKIKDIKITKSDFKGYYLTCQSQTPDFDCQGFLSEKLQSSSPTEINVKSDKGTPGKLNIITTEANNYSEGYVKARFMTSFVDFKPTDDIDSFAAKKSKEVLDLFHDKKINKDKLKQAITLYRREGLEAVTDPNYQKTIFLLDAMEIPFATSNNVEEKLHRIILNTHESKKLKNGIQISQAFSGDDLYILIKDHLGNNIDLVGADARGLAVTNMLSRFDELVKHNKPISTLSELTELSSVAIKGADTTMFNSMNTYIQKIEDSINSKLINPNELSPVELKNQLAKILKEANFEYNQLANTDPTLMNMRAARIDPSMIQEVKDVRNAMDEISGLHNHAKKLEDRGVIKLYTVDDLKMTQYFGKTGPALIIPDCLKHILGRP